MINSLKRLTAATALIFGVGLMSSTAMAQNVVDPNEDRYHPSFNDSFTVAACTNDTFTAPATIVTFQSITDWQRLAQGNPQGFQNAFKAKAQPLIDEAWQNVISKHSSGEFNTGDASFVQDAVAELEEAAKKIEAQTGVTVIIRGGPSGPATPGCS